MNDGLAWFKTSYSGSQGGACVELALDWHKSSYSSGEGGACVEVAVARAPGAVHVRDSKFEAGPRFEVSPEAWGAFVALAAR